MHADVHVLACTARFAVQLVTCMLLQELALLV